MTANGAFRLLVAESSLAVDEATQVAGCSPEVADLFGRLLTGAALLQLGQAPTDRLQIAVNHEGTAGQLLADIWPGPEIRGRVKNPRPEPGQLLAGNVTLEVSRSNSRRSGIYQSVVPVVEHEIGDALQRYVLESEQVLTFFSLVMQFRDDGKVGDCGGMMIQALPGASHEDLQAVTDCLEQANFAELVRSGHKPMAAAEQLFAPLSLQHLGGDPLVYKCRCSQATATAAVQLLDADELQRIREGETEEVVCDFCGSRFVVDASNLARA